MSKTTAWIKAMRLRTLPLSLAGIITGSSAAVLLGKWDLRIFVLALITTILFQIISNFANDLGDGQKGTDNDERVGPERAIQSGVISIGSMKIAVIITSVLSLISAGLLIYVGTENMPIKITYFYIGLALLSVISAITYTIGKKAYGYHGLGDLMVFFFFGIVSVYGVFSLYTKSFDSTNILLAVFVGFLSAAVLNLNNMRDVENDRNSNKNTLVVKMGATNAKFYHFLLITIGVGALVFYLFLQQHSILYFSLLPILFLLIHLRKVSGITQPKDFDPELKKVALSTFLIAVTLFCLSFMV